jgi:sugar phosphate isomerase/epimerase
MTTLSGFGDEISSDLEVQMDVLASEGIYYLELRSVGGKNVLQFSDEEASVRKKRLDARGFVVSSIASPIGQIMITNPFEPDLKAFKRAVSLAKFFETPYIRIFSFIIPPGKPPHLYKEEVIKRIKRFTSIAEEEEVILLLENDKMMYADTGERALDILQSIDSPHLRFSFDPANFIQSQVFPMTDAYPYVAPYIASISVKDARINTGEVVPAGEGDGQFRELLAALKERNYSGFMMIEPRGRPGFADPVFFREAAGALKKLLNEEGLKWSGHPHINSEEKKSSSNHLFNQIAIPSCSTKTSSEAAESWIPLTSLDKMAQTDYDVLIVGSGAGGGAALWRLCERWRNKGKKVGMIEAGNLALTTNIQNLALLSGERGEQYISKITKRIGQFLPEFSGAKQIIALGGRTLQWTAACPRMPSYILNTWPVTIKEMDVYYKIAEQVMKVNKAFANLGLLNKIFLNRLWEDGFYEAADIPMAIDRKQTKYGNVHSNAVFSSILFLAEAMNYKSIDLAIEARAVQVLVEKGNAVGVKVMSPDKKTYCLKAKTMILSASTFETPRLLMHSDIPGEAIGHYLIDHSAVRSTATLNRKKLPEDLGPALIFIPNTKEHPYQLEFGSLEYQLQEKLKVIFHGYGYVEPRFENKIMLDPKRKDAYGVPEIKIDFNYSQQDQVVIRQMTSDLRRVMRSLDVTETSNIYLRAPGDDNHEAGTCRMGDHPSTSAVNRFGQIHGIKGLYAADNSVLPTLGANPTLTTVALAIRTADYIIQQLK